MAGGEVEKDVAKEEVPMGMEGVERNEDEEEEKVEEEKDSEEDTSGGRDDIHRAMDVDTDKDYLQYLEELQRHPEYSPIHGNQAFARHPSDDSPSQTSDGHSQPSFNLFGVWPPPVGPSQ
ncbi:hypothetical protein PIB30_096243 [Stylosanthes scabra]|uniref:Uncharacterized protein n=1 Tax=Stylosanthes scabra TaxID=79078 RepID=A0ABU6SWM8_9FABA|nr:hypothetical protein [Stylosanthes scabra]